MSFFDRLARASMSPARLMMCDGVTGMYREHTAYGEVKSDAVCPSCGSKLGTMQRKGSAWVCGSCLGRVGC